MKVQELAGYATAGRMIPAAPVQAEHSIAIAAPIHRVWNLLTDVSRWESWYSYLKDARIEQFAAGGRLTYGGLFKHRLRIAKVLDEQLVVLYGTMLGFQGITRWDVRDLGVNQTKVTFTESSSGPLLGLLYSKQKLGTHLQEWLIRFQVRAERT